MLCPKCHRDTSDTTNTCVWCGATLDWSRSAADPGAAMQTGSHEGTAAGQQPAPGGYVSPGDAGFQAQGPPAGPASQRRAAGDVVRPSRPRERRWYLTPWPYAVAVLVAVGVFSFLLLRGNGKGAGAFPELVVGGKPTLLSVYTDT
jgi:hypothetical protein